MGSQLLSPCHPGTLTELFLEIPWFCLTCGAVVMPGLPCPPAPKAGGEREVSVKAECS